MPGLTISILQAGATLPIPRPAQQVFCTVEITRWQKTQHSPTDPEAGLQWIMVNELQMGCPPGLPSARSGMT